MFWDGVDEVQPTVAVVVPVEGIACSVYQQRWDTEVLAI